MTALSLFQGIAGSVAGAGPSCVRVKAAYILERSPAHRRALRGNLGFSILLKDSSTYSSAQPGGGGIWANDLPITSWSALNTDRQPADTCTVKAWAEESEEAPRDCFDSTVWDQLCVPHGEDTDRLTGYIADYTNCGVSFYGPAPVCLLTWHRNGRRHHLHPGQITVSPGEAWKHCEDL